jgi:hypothetical protein
MAKIDRDKLLRLILYAAATVVLVSGLVSMRHSRLASPTAGFVSFCLAVKAGSRRTAMLIAVLLSLGIAASVVAVNNIPPPTAPADGVLTAAVIIASFLLIFLKRKQPTPVSNGPNSLARE